MNINFYVLELEDDKIYVGKTNGITNRISTHFEGKGCKWTRIYNPKKLLHVYKNCKETDELNYVLIYMINYGVENVRSSSYENMILTDSQLNFLNNKLKSIISAAEIEELTPEEYVEKSLKHIDFFSHYNIWTDALTKNDIMTWIINKQTEKIYFYSNSHGNEEKKYEEDLQVLKNKFAINSTILVKETDDIIIFIKRLKKKFSQKELDIILDHLSLLH